MTSRPALILVTRPQEPGRSLAAALRGAGRDALWWPAFDLLPAEDPAALRACVARTVPADAQADPPFDLVVFVSPAAVQAFASALRAARPDAAWPARTTIGAMGAATRDALRSALPLGDRVRIVCPEGDAPAAGGSESLWTALRARDTQPRRVLIVRAQSGRELLGERLRQGGAIVEELAAYRRVAHAPGPAEWAALRAYAAAGAGLAVLYTSSEAVPVLAEALGRDAALQGWFAAATALCVHPRIVEALRTAGYTDVRLSEARCEAIGAALRRGKGTAGGPAAPDSRERESVQTQTRRTRIS